MTDEAKNVKEGGGAFPHYVEGLVNGLTKREWFAGMALQVIARNISIHDFDLLLPKELAEGAFNIADAMIERRKR